jgi:hypothetical protein
MTYPDGIDALVNVNAGDTLAAGGHAARHNSVNTALEEVKDLLNAGDAGEVLTAAGSAAPPIWAPVAAGGKILQIVRATDSTNRDTTSTSFVDANISVTITPQKNDSAVILISTCYFSIDNSGGYLGLILTDSSNNVLSGGGSDYGASSAGTDFQGSANIVGYVTTAGTGARTYKLRFRRAFGTGTVKLLNGSHVAQLYAIEVSA